ncbi:MAG: polysaccharide biosynthesis tyrosine autokinase [Bacteroidota bacterium]
MGLAVPAGISFLADILNDKVTIEEDIKAKTQVPVLGTINFSKKEEQRVIKKGSRSGIAERFRLLRTNLQYLNTQKKDNFTILTTSNASGEGKSFISLNLAASLALSEQKVLLIGLDLRKPKLKLYLGFDENTTGMSHFLAGAADKKDIIHKVDRAENLYFIPSGIVPPNPAEMIMSRQMQTLIEELKQEFNYIIIDMPPLGLVTDAFLLSEQVDLALFAVRFKKTPKAVLARLEELRQSNKFSQLGIVFNGVKAGARYGGYRYGYGYGYGYGDGYGYYEEA